MSSFGSFFVKYIYESTTSAEPPCTQGILLSTADRFIFWIGGGIAFFLTLFLLVGAMISRRLREQPGDLIIGIAFSDFLLSIHWLTLATFYTSVDDTTFCEIVGGIGTFAGINEFLYNVSFSIFMVISLRNALKQDKIPKRTFHVVNLTIAIGYLIYLYSQGQIGKTIVGTCSIRQECSSNFLSYLGAAVVACYAIIGTYTYLFVKKNAPKCQKAHAKRTGFLMYYQRYVIACITVYLMITVATVITTIASNEMVSEDEIITPQEGQSFRWTSSLYNLVKLCSPLVLSFVRLNDPKIKAVVKQGIFFWRRDIPIRNEIEAKIMNPLINGVSDDSVNLSFERSRTFTDGGILLSTLSKDRKVELTYTLLSCVAIARKYQETLSDTPSMEVYDRKENNRFQHERVFLIDDAILIGTLPDIQAELHRTKYTLLSGTLKVYSPEVFNAFIDEDKEFLNIIDSLDFFTNRDEIKEASGSDGGKSGEFFFFSKDQKLIIKTIPDEELEMLIFILERYEAHFKQYPLSLIAKIYGAYTYENTDLGLKFNLIAMKNICGFNSQYVERKYDMKGSKYDREALKGVDASEEVLRKKVMKDSDFEKYEKKLCLEKEVSRYFLTQVELDSLFFRSVDLIDYSFMVYVVNKGQARAEMDLTNDFTAKNSLASIPHNEKPGLYYNMGIIDYLQPYNFKKAFERFLKRLKKLDPNLDTSSQDPEYYSTRFIQFMKRLVKQE